MYNILVTGVGAIIGYGIIDSLKQSSKDVNVIGMDIFEDAAGRFMADKFYQAILAKDPGYPDYVNNLIEKEKIDLVFLGTEHEIYALCDNKEKLGDNYSKIVINTDQNIAFSKDKWETYSFLQNHGIKTIKTVLDGEYDELCELLGSPFLLKPKNSTASKGIHTIENREEFDFYKKQAGDQRMFQQIVGDKEHEYTVSVFGYGDGTSTKPFALRRKLSGEGATVKAWIYHDPLLDLEVEKLVKILKPYGPTNLQFRLHEGEYYMLEINPRVSSACSIRTAFGYNEPEMCIEYYLEHKTLNPTFREEGTAIRYIKDMII